MNTRRGNPTRNRRMQNQRRLLAFFCIGVLCGLFPGAALIAAPVPNPSLVLDGQEITAGSTLEVRFPTLMVEARGLGIPVDESPVVLTPPLEGAFTWLSQKSGVFVPKSAPAMGARYTLAVRKGVKDATGKSVGAGWNASFKTPAFALINQSAGWSSLGRDDLPALPQRFLIFNRNVNPAEAARFMRFVDKRGRSITAVARHAFRHDGFSAQAGEGDWDTRWMELSGNAAVVGKPQTRPDSVPEDDEDESHEADGNDPANDVPLQHRLVVGPQSPLPTGEGWRLEIRAGMPSQKAGALLARAHSIPLGNVQPFHVTGVHTASYLNAGRSLSLRFSHPLAEDVRVESGRKFFRLIPEPENVEYEIDFRGITIHGAFQREVEYRLEVDPSLMSSAGHTVEGTLSHPVRFKPMEARVYLPEIESHQIAGGQRKLPVRSVNLRALHVRAVLVDPQAAVSARETFGRYARPENAEPVEDPGSADESGEKVIPLYQRIDPREIPGRVLVDKNVPLSDAQLDARVETVLDWSEILGGVRTGMVFLTVEGVPLEGVKSKRAGSQCLMQLTDLGVLWKKEAAGLRAHVFSMESGLGLADAALTLIGAGQRELSKKSTDGAGDAVLEVPEEPGWLRVYKDGDTHVLPMGEHAQLLPNRAFRINYAFGPDEESWVLEKSRNEVRAVVFTDRPLYRRGETVHIKGILREMSGAGLILPGENRFKLVLNGGTPHQRREFPVHVDAVGEFTLDVPLLPHQFGAFYVQLQRVAKEHDSVTASTHFEIADFQPDAFEVDVAVPKRLAPTDALVAQVRGKYFFGSPLHKAEARWVLQMRRRTFSPANFEGFVFSDSDTPLAKGVVLTGTGSFSAEGTLSIQPAIPKAAEEPMLAVLSVDVTDLNQQTVSRRVLVDRDSSQFYLGLNLSEGVSRAGDPVKACAVAVDPAGQPLPQPVQVRYELFRIRHETVRLQGAGKAVSFKTDHFPERLEERDADSVMPVQKVGIWHAPESGGVVFVPAQAGDYEIRATARDASGKTVRSSVSFFVSGPDRVSWAYRNPVQIDLLPGKPSYAAGDVARIAVKTPISGEALLTVERGNRVLRSRTVRVEENAPEVDVPLEPGDAPNVVVSLVLVRGARDSTRRVKTAEYRYGACEIEVSDPSTRLEVAVESSKPRVRPGDAFDAVVAVRDASGAPVPDARVTFYAVDDGVLALRGFSRPNPHPVFFAPIPYSVRTGMTLYRLFSEDPAELTFSNKGYLIGGGGVGDRLAKLRTNFPGTLAWHPDLKTDAAGTVRIPMTAPDALTRYRLVAVAHAGVQRFGSAESAVQIHKAFSLLSALGQAAHTGDRLLARAVARNDSPQSGRARVRLDLDERGQAGSGALEREVELAAGESTEVDFAVDVRGAGTARWIFSGSLSAGGTLYSDALEVPLHVEAPAPVLREVYLRDLPQVESDLLAGVNPQLLEGAGAVEVTLSNTRLASLRSGAEWLLKYPYGCAEQRISAMVPWVMLGELSAVLPDLPQDEQTRQSVLSRSFAKLVAQQLPDGGLAYWPGGRPSLFASAYALWALEPVFQKENAAEKWKVLVQYVANELRSRDKDSTPLGPDLSAFALAALAHAGHAEPAYQERLWEKRAELSREGRALLACALIRSGAQARQIDTLLDPKSPARESAGLFGGSPLRERAIRLMALSAHTPQSPELEVLTREILRGQVAGHWRTTQENAWAILALGAYFKNVERSVPTVDAVLKRGTSTVAKGAAAHPVRLDARTLAQRITERFGGETPLLSLAVSNPANARLYAETRFEVQPRVELQPRQARGFSVSRCYWKEAVDGRWEEARDLRVGDRVLVDLRVESDSPAAWVAIEDPLPAVLEAINPNFRAAASGLRMPPVRPWAASYQEVQAGRVVFFCDDLPAGNFSFQYLARVRMAGKVIAPQTKVEEMYHPERLGLSDSAWIEAQPR